MLYGQRYGFDYKYVRSQIACICEIYEWKRLKAALVLLYSFIYPCDSWMILIVNIELEVFNCEEMKLNGLGIAIVIT